MATNLYTEAATKRIAHIKSHLNNGFNVDTCVRNIENGQGNVNASFMRLSSHAEASAMFAWFGHRDLDAMRQWCHVASKLDQVRYQMEEDTLSPGAKMLQLLLPLLSNNESLIQWFASHDRGYDAKRIESPKTHDFWAYQSILALRGDWNRLTERCELVIKDPPTASNEKKYQIDHQFFLALAQRDLEKMQAVIHEIVSPKVVAGRNIDESGFTEDLISKAAVIYAKIAWRHGYRVNVESRLVPGEWLPVEPLGSYNNHYSFLK